MKKVQSNAHKTDEFFLAQSRDEQSDVKQFKRLKIMLKTKEYLTFYTYLQ